MRIMGLDFGSKTVGVAISDPLFLTAQGIEIVRRKSQGKLRQTLARIEELKEEYEVGKIVLGFPKNMNNTEGERCEKTLEFKEMLEKRTGLEVVLWDERLTTVEADRTMMQVGTGCHFYLTGVSGLSGQTAHGRVEVRWRKLFLQIRKIRKILNCTF